MTSATPLGRAPRPRNRPRPRPRRGGAFTLLETVLAVLLVAALAAVTVMALGSAQRGAALDEGARRFVTVLRRARSDAAHRGRRLRLAPADAAGGFDVLWEPAPLAEPGAYEPYTAGLWRAELPTDLVRIESCRRVGPDAPPSEADAQAELQAITFRPDGSCDTAVVVLASREEPEAAGRAVIELDGLAGTIRLRTATAEQLDAIRRDDGTFDWAELDDE